MRNTEATHPQPVPCALHLAGGWVTGSPPSAAGSPEGPSHTRKTPPRARVRGGRGGILSREVGSQEVLHQVGSAMTHITLTCRSLAKASHGAEAVVEGARKYNLLEQ